MEDNVYSLIKKVTGFPDAEKTYSPFFSSIGLCATDNENGVGRMYFAYNAFTRALFEKTLDFGCALNTEKSSIYNLVFGEDKVSLSFWKSDGIIIDCNGIDDIGLFSKVSSSTTDLWVDNCDGEYLILQGYSRNGDARDSDSRVNFVIGVRALCGNLSNENGMHARAVNGKITLAICFEALKATAKYVRSVLANAPADVDSAAKICRRWLKNNISGAEFETENEDEASAAAYAAKELLFNMTKAQGELESFITPFPSRGSKPYASLTDIFFLNYGYSALGCPLTKDFVKQVSHNRRPTGKIPSFMTSTWACPGAPAQPFLGKAVINEIEYDYSFGWDTFSAIESNNKWWTSTAINKYGLVTDAYENKITASLNALLLNQLRCAVDLAAQLGLEERDDKWKLISANLEKNIVKYLYDKENNIFCDADTSMATVLPSVSSSIIALWSGVEIENSKALDMIRNCVLTIDNEKSISPEYIFFKYQLLKKYHFDDEAKKTSAEYITTFTQDYKDGGEMADNSIACALYLYLLDERS